MMEHAAVMWSPITDLPNNWQALKADDLTPLVKTWNEQRASLDQRQLDNFTARLRRRLAIETGVIERLYDIDRGITQVLIERGLEDALLSHADTNRPPYEVMALLRDQEDAIIALYKEIKDGRELSQHFIRQLHQQLTAHQETTEAIDQFGNRFETKLLRGEYKKQVNNPLRPDGSVIHVYCPPEQVNSQMEQMIAWHREHLDQDVSPEVEAAWLHHRFAQIHPFQDGNGRVARLLASMVFIRAGWFPLVITRDDREDYLDALKDADDGDLKPLIGMVARAQVQAFNNALELGSEIQQESKNSNAALAVLKDKIKQVAEEENKRRKVTENRIRLVEGYAVSVHQSTRDYLEGVRGGLEDAVRGTSITVRTSQAEYDSKPGQGADERFRSRIIRVARELDYFANLTGYKSWIGFTMQRGNVRVGMLFSIHVVGRPENGLMACTGSVIQEEIPVRSEASDEPQYPKEMEFQVLSQTPFQFSNSESLGDVQKRYNRWLENATKVGIDFITSHLLT